MAATPQYNLKRHAWKFIVFLGFVSMFTDITYEGGRSIIGPFLAILGASALTVGFVAGFGELIGYGVRLLTGYISDRTGKIWVIMLIGYAINVFALPLLALTHSVSIAALLIIAERLGKAIRTPTRDVMLSQAGSQTGLGRGFGLHKFLDATGAVTGPLMISAVLYYSGDYRLGFAMLVFPALIALSILVRARFLYPEPKHFESSYALPLMRNHKKLFWIYLGAVSFIAMGFADFPLIAYHFQKSGIMTQHWIPLSYAIAMFVEAMAVLPMGWLFDRFGIKTMVGTTLL